MTGGTDSTYNNHQDETREARTTAPTTSAHDLTTSERKMHITFLLLVFQSLAAIAFTAPVPGFGFSTGGVAPSLVRRVPPLQGQRDRGRQAAQEVVQTQHRERIMHLQQELQLAARELVRAEQELKQAAQRLGPENPLLEPIAQQVLRQIDAAYRRIEAVHKESLVLQWQCAEQELARAERELEQAAQELDRENLEPIAQRVSQQIDVVRQRIVALYHEALQLQQNGAAHRQQR